MGLHWNEDMYGIARVKKKKVYHSGFITVIESRFSHSVCTVFKNLKKGGYVYMYN